MNALTGNFTYASDCNLFMDVHGVYFISFPIRWCWLIGEVSFEFSWLLFFEAVGRMPHIMVSICCFTPLGNTILWSFSRGLILFFSHFVRFHSRIVLILFIGVAQVGIRSPSSKETILATQCWPSRGDTCMNCFLCLAVLPVVSYMSLCVA